ncbi:MAG: nodulation protein NfeD [Chloroflexi bacterium]|nr:nodulation protein NfeD [Chloroflexota bacterium]MYA00491.1 nodulation protein NfeD [Chloroflexota bacterium]MYC02440.1 nodulation protein NfeD [Chloroflexota bacterium]MYJ92186.1 nodulation protein NfeD [Chloroflexota bacterium]
MRWFVERPLRALAVVLIGLGIGSALLSGCGSDNPPGGLHVSEMAQEIGPVSANFVNRALDRAERQDAVAWILMLDTPGGLITSTDDIVQRILAAEIPVIVFVSPAGARAASAGTFITLAGHVAAMAPNTQIGAAHPISGSGEDIEGDLNDKVTNDAAADIRGIAKHRGRNEEWAEQAVRESVSVTGDEAVELNVVDLVAADLNDLIAQIDGRSILLEPDGERITLEIADAPIVETNYNFAESVLDVIADPNIAFLFTSIGSLLLLIEAFSPGLVGPGVFGVIMLIFGFFALGPLDTNPAGIALLVLAIILLVAEVFVAGFGFLGIGGIIALVLGGLLLIGDASVDAEKVSIWALVVGAGLVGVVVFGLGTLIAVDRRKPKWSFQASHGIVGKVGHAHSALSPGGTVMVDAELWSARAAAGVEIAEGTSINVIGMEGLTAIVESSESEEELDE